ncbi:MAG TPA: pitrilysin family protein [Acidobacteriota bacterium]|nr:pitrilysin family protein [Acidobacteriota bacterium]
MKDILLRKQTLRNGLVMYEDPIASQSITILCVIHMGSAYESISGISHFVEHMIFEGTKKRKTARDVAKEIDDIGGEFNAMTSRHSIIIYCKVPRQHTQKAADVLVDCITNATFLTVDKERNVIKNEIALLNDEPRQRQWELFDKTLYPNHPVSRPIAGTIASLDSISKKDLVNFYTENFVAKNMSLVVCGKLNNSQKENIKSLFSTIKSGKKSKNTIPKYNPPKSADTNYMKELSQAYISIGWRIPDEPTKDTAVHDIIGAILTKGQSGILFDELRNKHGLTYDVRSYTDTGPCGSCMATTIICDPKKTDVVLKRTNEIFETMNNVTEKTVTDAKTYLLGRYQLQLEDTVERAQHIADNIIDNNFTPIAQTKKVTAADIQKTFKKIKSKTTTMLLREKRQ